MSSDFLTWSPGITLEEIEKQVIQKAYKYFRQNKTLTSNSLNIAIRTLDNKLEKYELERLEEEKKNEERQAKREQFLLKARGNLPDNVGISSSRSSMESSSYSQAKSEMSMPERKEVQEMLLKSSSKMIKKEDADKYKDQMKKEDLVFITKENEEKILNLIAHQEK